MTLAQCIDLYHQRTATRPLDFVPSAVTLTPRGDVTVALARLKRQLGALDAEDRAAARDALAGVVAELDAVAWSDFGAALAPHPPVEAAPKWCFFCGTERPADVWDCPVCPPSA